MPAPRQRDRDEPREQLARLFPVAFPDVDLDVGPARANEGLVQRGPMVRGQEDHPPFARANPVEHVQDSGERELVLRLLVAAAEGGIDVFEAKDAVARERYEKVL